MSINRRVLRQRLYSIEQDEPRGAREDDCEGAQRTLHPLVQHRARRAAAHRLFLLRRSRHSSRERGLRGLDQARVRQRSEVLRRRQVGPLAGSELHHACAHVFRQLSEAEQSEPRRRVTDLVVLVVAPNKDVASKVGSVGVLDGIVLRDGNVKSQSRDLDLRS